MALATLSRRTSTRAISKSANHRFKFEKRAELFIRTHNETLSVAAMRVSNPDRSLFKIES
jgi:hypothetical protein